MKLDFKNKLLPLQVKKKLQHSHCPAGSRSNRKFYPSVFPLLWTVFVLVMSGDILPWTYQSVCIWHSVRNKTMCHSLNRKCPLQRSCWHPKTVCAAGDELSFLLFNKCPMCYYTQFSWLSPSHYLQSFLIILQAAARPCGQGLLQQDVIDLLCTVLWLLRYGWWQAVSVRIEHIAWQGSMGTDSWPPAAAVNSAGEQRGWTGARAAGSQLGLTAGAVVKARQHRAIAVAPAHHRPLPIKR